MCISFMVHLYYMFYIYLLCFMISIFSKILRDVLFLASQFIFEDPKALAAFFFSMFLLNGKLLFHSALPALS